MKKYFIINSPMIKEVYTSYEKELEKQRRVYTEFKKQHGIEAEEFYVDRKQFAIVASKRDYEKFKEQVTKEENRYGLSRFKQNSIIGKEWKKIANKEDIKVCNSPILMWMLNGIGLSGKSRQTIFEIEGVLYGSLDMYNDFEIEPGQITEIKASEFHKIVEDYNTKIAIQEE